MTTEHPDSLARWNAAAVRASEEMGQRMLAAIAAGSEREPCPVNGEAGTERPLAAIFAPAAPPAQIPATPQRYRYLAQRLAKQRRREFAEDLRTREQERAAELPPARRGRFTLLHLREGLCHYPTRARPYFFCGGVAKRGPYCARHARECYQRAR